MSEHVAPPPKPRLSPLDLRNTDLVSRFLAATPPYLYNMSLLPNTHFFSEMLRSIVQAKAESANSTITSASNNRNNVHQRRTRKRPWPTKTSLSPPRIQEHDWITPKTDNPLELTTNNTSPSEQAGRLYHHPPPLENEVGASHHNTLSLPPPPPIWYPPLYPTPPYGVDPLHFFIDLRVSGHIYDKNSSAAATTTKIESTDKPPNTIQASAFKQSRHSSAFSVPQPRSQSQKPINLSNDDKKYKNNLKFDVKSMGFEKESNKTGSNYVLSNIGQIYRNVDMEMRQQGEIQVSSSKNGATAEAQTEDASAAEDETDEERQKRVRDLKALIGLELVVDYMNHARPGVVRKSLGDDVVNCCGSSGGDLESLGSPTLEVVDDT